MQSVIAFITAFGMKLLGAIIVLVVGLYVIKLVKKFIRTSKRMDKMDKGLRTFLVSFSSVVLSIVLVITVAAILGVPATSFLTILASCGLAVGLALQGSLSNFAGGVLILLFKPFKVGDFIDAGGKLGTVTEINVVYTVLTTLDNKRVTIPNGSITNAVVENYSAEDLRRVDLVFTASYTNDLNKVKSIISDVIAKHPLALQDPAPFVRMSKHAENALEYTVRIWCKNADYWDVYFDVIEQVKQAFDANDISIPFPQLDVHVEK